MEKTDGNNAKALESRDMVELVPVIIYRLDVTFPGTMLGTYLYQMQMRPRSARSELLKVRIINDDIDGLVNNIFKEDLSDFQFMFDRHFGKSVYITDRNIDKIKEALNNTSLVLHFKIMRPDGKDVNDSKSFVIALSDITDFSFIRKRMTFTPKRFMQDMGKELRLHLSGYLDPLIAEIKKRVQ